MRPLLVILVLLIPIALVAQPVQPASVQYVSSDPSGSCGNGVMRYNYTTGSFWGCENNVWTLVSGSSSGGGGGLPPGAPANQILNGCGVEYTGGLSFTVGQCTYAIGGQNYTSPLVTLTLSAADPTNPRIDAIIVDIFSVASVQTGTPAATPAQPTIDPSTQLLLTFALVAANATTPSNITTDSIYDENTEWTCTASAHFNCASTSNPYHGTTDIEFTSAVLNNNVTLVKPAAGTVDLATRNTLIFYLRSKATWPTGASGSTAARSLAVWWQNGATQKGLQVIVKSGVFGFSSSSTAAYQQIAIPTSLFGANGLPVTTLKFNISGPSGSSSIGGYIDEVTLQGGLNPPALPTTLMNFRGTYSSATAYNPNDVACAATGLCYVALLANTNVAQTTTATWQPASFANSTIPANGNCVTWSVSGSLIKLGDTGSPCGGTPGGGIIGYSASSITLTAATRYFPIVGAGLPSTTETDVDTEAPSAATISNFYASISTALGVGNSAVFTYRKNASDQSMTCTISGGSATTCNDSTHSFNVVAGDLITIKVVTTGTIVATPTLVMTAQFGTTGSNGTVNTGTSGNLAYYAASGTAVSDAGKGLTVMSRRACVFDNDSQSATVLTAAQFSGHCVVPFAATIVEVDVSGGTQTLTGSATAPTFTGTSSIQIGKKGVTNNTALLSGALATASGVACALTSTAGTCLFNNAMTSSGTITISTTSISAGDELYVSAATADGVQTWYTVAVIFTVN